jgi:putative NADH-flavin reductase
MKVAIFGSTGMLGMLLTKVALEAGHDIVTLVRKPEKLGGLASQIKVLKGDYFSPKDQRATLEGVDAVLTTIGPTLKRGQNQGEYTLAMQSLVAAMQDTSVQRIVAVGGAGLKLGDEKLSFGRAIMRQILRLGAGADYADKENEHNVLFRSSLNWTIVRPPQIADATGKFTPTLDKVAGFKVDAGQLAKYMVDSLEDTATIRTAPFVATV